MQLNLNNVAKVKEATIHVNGITVIAGENNTGKSTIGKILFGMFNSMCNINEKVEKEKYDRIQKVLLSSLQNHVVNTHFLKEKNFYEVGRQKILKGIDKTILEADSVEEYIKDYIDTTKMYENLENPEEWIKASAEKIEAIINILDKKIVMEVSTRWFDKIFDSQISPLNDENTISTMNLKIKDKMIKYDFQNNACIDWESDINLLHQAFYIDNPFVIDHLSERWTDYLNVTDEHLLEYLQKENGIFDNIIETILAKNKLKEIDAILSGIVGGEFISNAEGQYCLSSKKFKKPINIRNLSTGLKSFALIKKLLENGSLKEKDVLILDEPEIHLHPEWQLAYAEIIVLLQKKFDLTIIITTHSPYFLDAIDVYAAKYEISDKINYYLAENIEEVSCLQDVTENIDIIYKKLSDPLQKLENMRNDLR